METVLSLPQHCIVSCQKLTRIFIAKIYRADFRVDRFAHVSVCTASNGRKFVSPNFDAAWALQVFSSKTYRFENHLIGECFLN